MAVKTSYLLVFLIILTNFLMGNSELLGGLRSLIEEVNTKNLQMAIARSHEREAKEELSILQASKSFQFTSKSGWVDKKEGLYSRQFSRKLNIKQRYFETDFSVSKSFPWGGEAALEQSFTYFKESQQYEFHQGPSYKQDFGKDLFGRSYKKKLEQKQGYIEQKHLEKNWRKHEQIYQVIMSYLDVQKYKELGIIQDEMMKQTNEHISYIEKSVKDGLKDSVDLLEIKAIRVRQEIEFERIDNQRKQSEFKLSLLLQRKIFPNDLDRFSLNQFSDFEEIRKKRENYLLENKEIIIKTKIVENSQKVLEEKKFQDFPDISLKLSYLSSASEKSFQSSLKNGRLSSGDRGISIKLDFQTPLGSSSQKKSIRLAKMVKRRLEIEKLKKIAELKFEEEKLEKEEKTLKKNMAKNKIELELLKKNYSEYKKLYRLGQRNIDQLLRTEERYLKSRRDLINEQLLWQKNIIKWHYLWGDFTQL